jgi:hypothetical protein
MRRQSLAVRQRLLSVAAAMSLVLLLASVAVWLWSYPNWRVGAHRGQLLLVVFDPVKAEEQQLLDKHGLLGDLKEWSETTWPRADGWSKGALGFRFGHGSRRFDFGTAPVIVSFSVCAMPCWFIVAVLAVLPVMHYLRFWRQRRRTVRGLCAACGYDLRGSPDRCPECGAVPQPPHNPPMQRTATASSGAVV